MLFRYIILAPHLRSAPQRVARSTPGARGFRLAGLDLVGDSSAFPIYRRSVGVIAG